MEVLTAAVQSSQWQAAEQVRSEEGGGGGGADNGEGGVGGGVEGQAMGGHGVPEHRLNSQCRVFECNKGCWLGEGCGERRVGRVLGRWVRKGGRGGEGCCVWPAMTCVKTGCKGWIHTKTCMSVLQVAHEQSKRRQWWCSHLACKPEHAGTILWNLVLQSRNTSEVRGSRVSE